jgi:3-oxoacyl-[acyl-carrier-protein] synthase II
MADKRVCVTGIGVVSPLGRDGATFWSALGAGRSGIAPATAFDAAGLRCRIAGEVREYAPREDIDPAAAAMMDRRALFAADAAIQALVQSELPITAETVQALGVAVGSELPERGSVASAATLARTVGAGGPVAQFSAGAAGGLMAIGEACEWIRREDCSFAVAGGVDAPIERMWFEHYAPMLTARNDDPSRAARPYDAARDGFALSEGAAMLVLEDEEIAVRRAATILAYVDGYGATFNRAPVAHAAANPADAGRAMQAALLKWDVVLQGEVDVIFGSASGGPLDAIEGQAIARVWGPNRDRLWVTSIRGALGHTLGAAGAFSAVAAIFCVQSGLIPPTLNLTEQDPDCGGLEIVTEDVRRLHGSRALVNAFGLGHNASLIVSRP